MDMKSTHKWTKELAILGTLIGCSFFLNIFNQTYLNRKSLEYNMRMFEIEIRENVGLDLIGNLAEGHQLEDDEV
jgi:hypothetical protein